MIDNRANSRSRAILMVGPIPVGGGYTGGIAMSIGYLIDSWDLATPLLHFNTELLKRSYGTTGQLSLRNVFLAVVNFARLSYTMVRIGPKLMHYHTSRAAAFLKDMLFAGLLRCFFGVPTILHINSSDATSILIGHTRCLRRFQLRVLEYCCDRLVVLSDNVLNDFAAILGGRAGERFRSRCTVLRNFTPLPDVFRRHREEIDCVRVFYIGNIGREKGIHDVIHAASQLKAGRDLPFKLILAGSFNDQREEHRVRKLVADYDLHDTVVFPGTVYGRKKEEAFLEADIFVLPSYSEGIPLSMLEAMSYGLPVVVSGVGGIPEVVRDGQEGRIIKAGDVDGLCRALCDLIESGEYRRRMGAAARRRIAAHHTVEIYMQQLQDLYSSLLACGGYANGARHKESRLSHEC